MPKLTNSPRAFKIPLDAVEVLPQLYRLDAPFSRALNKWIKEGDGDRNRWHFDYDRKLGPTKAWYIPMERLADLERWCVASGWDFKIRTNIEAASHALAI